METVLDEKYIDESWDFEDANTKILTHCFHSYPAMMIPQVAARLIEKYGRNANLLFDPYCGTGTSLVEAKPAIAPVPPIPPIPPVPAVPSLSWSDLSWDKFIID